MFSTMTNQMSSWLGGLSKKPAEESELSTNEGSELSDKDKEMHESKTDTPTSQKSVKGSLDEQDNGSSTTEGADSNISSPDASPTDDKYPAGGVSEKFNQGAKSFGSFLSSAFNKAGKTVSDAGTKIKKSVAENSMLTEFNKDNEEFASAIKRHGPASPPWTGLPDEDALREQILSLSTDKRNFVRSPPSGVQFQFELDTFLPVAAAILKEDVDLQSMRYELVPKTINEESFWRNYFYRVSLIKQSTELSSLAQHGSVDSSRTSSMDAPDPSTVAKDEDDTVERADSPHEFVSDGIQPSSRDLEEVRAGIRQMGVSKKEEDWERELNAELGEYEMVAGADVEPNAASSADWEQDIEQMLQDEQQGEDDVQDDIK